MTDREKALESLLKERDYLVADYCDGNPRHKRLTNFLYAVRSALSSPSFDDAVKIVEDFTENIGKNQKRLYAENPKNPRTQQAKYALWALDGLLTALRERGKGK